MNPELMEFIDTFENTGYNYVSYQVASCQKYYEPKQSEGNWIRHSFVFFILLSVFARLTK